MKSSSSGRPYCPASTAASVSTDASSFFSSPPSLVKNFNPFRLKGRWLAVIITAPSNPLSGSTVDWNIAGVEISPQSYTEENDRPRKHASFRGPAVIRLSWPTPILSAPAGFPVRSARNFPKAAQMKVTSPGVSVFVSVSVAIAAPRTSLPF